MIENWLALITNMNGTVRDLRQAAPDVMKTFSDMARTAHGGNALDEKTKELVALAISVAIRCEPCIAYHAEGDVKHGASREAVAETLGMAIYMGAGPSVMYAAKALEAVDQIASTAARSIAGDPARWPRRALAHRRAPANAPATGCCSGTA